MLIDLSVAHSSGKVFFTQMQYNIAELLIQKRKAVVSLFKPVRDLKFGTTVQFQQRSTRDKF